MICCGIHAYDNPDITCVIHSLSFPWKGNSPLVVIVFSVQDFIVE